jgi:hypothetical protein
MTISIGEDQSGWRQQVEHIDDRAIPHIEAQLYTYDAMRNQKDMRVTQVRIRELHEMITAGEETYQVWTDDGPQWRELPKGTYKTAPNHVIQQDGRLHSYCPVGDTQAEMSALVRELNSEAFQSADAISQASYSHWALTHIHPFSDGNGRVARALASLYSLHQFDVPILIFADRKQPYYQCLEAADHGRFDEFIAYLDGRIQDTAAWINELESDYSTPTLASELSTLVDLVKSRGGIALENPDAAAVRVRARLTEILQELFSQELEHFPGTIGFSDQAPWMMHLGSSFGDINEQRIGTELTVPISSWVSPVSGVLVR